VLGADVDPAAAATAVVAAIEPFGAKPGALAAIIGMPDCKNRAWLSGLQWEKARLRLRQVRRQQKHHNEKGDGAKDCHSRLSED